MLDVGFSEILVIFVLALVVLGPEKLPRVAAQVGRWIGRARGMARQFREQLEEEVHLEEVRKSAQSSQSSAAQQPVASPAESSSMAEPVAGLPSMAAPDYYSQAADSPRAADSVQAADSSRAADSSQAAAPAEHPLQAEVFPAEAPSVDSRQHDWVGGLPSSAAAPTPQAPEKARPAVAEAGYAASNERGT